MKFTLKRNKRLRFHSVLIFLIIQKIVIGQVNVIELHKKYWYYKARLNNDFVKVGSDFYGHGQSIPFNQRALSEGNSYQGSSDKMKSGDGSAQLGVYLSVLATEYKLLQNQGADLTKIKHEIFCALNAINRLDYFAESFMSAKQHPNNPQSVTGPLLNGFFMRDDFKSDFVQNNYWHFNYFNDSSNYFGQGPVPVSYIKDKGFTQITQQSPVATTLNPHGQLNINSSCIGFTNAPNSQDWYVPLFPPPQNDNSVLKSFEESQDQLYYLLMGTALVSKLVGQNETDNGAIFNYEFLPNSNLVEEAKKINKRLIQHAGNNALWQIQNPENAGKQVQIGGSAIAYAYALDNLGCFVEYGQDFPSWGIGLGATISNNCTDFRNAGSITNLAWNGIAINANGGPTVDMQGFFHALAGVCNCIMEDKTYKNLVIQALITAIESSIAWIQNRAQELIEDLPEWATNSINAILNWANRAVSALLYLKSIYQSSLIGLVKVNTTEERLIFNNYINPVIYENCINNPVTQIGSQELFGVLLWRVLHPNPAAIPNWVQILTGNISPFFYSNIKQDVEQVLNAAPCVGNYNFFGNNSYPSPGPQWGNPNRFDRMDPTYRYNTCPTTFLGEYHGLDYMLLHNLYFLSRSEGNPSEIDYTDRNVNFSMPNGPQFTSSNINTLGAYEYIRAKNIINSNGGANYRAGKEIALLPNGSGGFSSIIGSDFHAHISPYTCSNGQYIGEMLRSANQPPPEADGPENSTTETNKSESAVENPPINPDLLTDFKNQLDSIINTPDLILHPLVSKIELFPIPNKGNFNIAFSLGNNDNVSFKIYDAVGKEVFSERNVTGYMVMPIDLSRLSKGIYMANFINTTGEVVSKKITID